MFYLLVGLVSCYPVCHFLPTFVHRSFPSTPPVPPSLRIPLVRFSATPPVAPPPPIPLDTTYGGCAALPTQLSLILVSSHHEPFGCSASSSCHLTMNRSAASRIPPHHFPAFFCCSGPQRGLNSKHEGGKFR